jgi:hypothetical protein
VDYVFYGKKHRTLAQIFKKYYNIPMLPITADIKTENAPPGRFTAELQGKGFALAPGSRLPAPGSRLPAPGSRLPAPGSYYPLSKSKRVKCPIAKFPLFYTGKLKSLSIFSFGQDNAALSLDNNQRLFQNFSFWDDKLCLSGFLGFSGKTGLLTGFSKSLWLKPVPSNRRFVPCAFSAQSISFGTGSANRQQICQAFDRPP